MQKQPMSPAEFDYACREFESIMGNVSQTSGIRSDKRNESVGGHRDSKHIIGMARDYVSDDGEYESAEVVAGMLGLWFVSHDVDSGNHIHIQGLEPGPIPQWWLDKYGDE